MNLDLSSTPLSSSTIINNEECKTNIRDELIQIIKEWIKLESEVIKLKSETKIRTEKHKQLTKALIEIMKQNDINCFEIHDGSLIYKKKKTRKSISGKFLLTQLQKYYVDSPDFAKELTQTILNNREQIFKDELLLKR